MKNNNKKTVLLDLLFWVIIFPIVTLIICSIISEVFNVWLGLIVLLGIILFPNFIRLFYKNKEQKEFLTNKTIREFKLFEMILFGYFCWMYITVFPSLMIYEFSKDIYIFFPVLGIFILLPILISLFYYKNNKRWTIDLIISLPFILYVLIHIFLYG